MDTNSTFAIMIYSLLYGVAVAFQLAAVVFCILMMRQKGYRNPWMVLLSALLVMLVFRVLGAFQSHPIISQIMQGTNAMAAAVISILLFTSLFFIRRVWLAERQSAEIAQRHAAERDEAKDRFAQLADFIPQLAWMARPDGWLFWYNRRWFDYTGATPAEMPGNGWQKVLDPQALRGITERFQSAIARGESWEDIFTLRRHDGEFRWHLSRAMPFRDSKGNIVLWFGTHTDITDQRQADETRQKILDAERAARAAAERAGRMKDEFLATLSHELRTPLNAILGWAQLLRMSPPKPDDLAQGLETIERNARVQTQLIEDLLDMSRIISGKLRVEIQTLNPLASVEAAVETVRPAADAKGIRIQTLLDSWAGPIAADPGRLQQIVWNLLSNAIKFTPKGGKAMIQLRRVESHVQIAVIDTGPGIDPQFIPHIFERFSQADSSTTRKHGGLGLGLSIVKHLIELHGGTVAAYNNDPEPGATFTVQFPVLSVMNAVPRPAASVKSPQLSHVNKLSGLKVLIVDDEPDARNLISRVLGECGAVVNSAASGLEALSNLEHHKPDVLVSDIGMPDMDGFELLRKIRAAKVFNGERIPAIALTALARSEDRTRAILAGYVVHISKPVEAEELIATVASVAGRTGGE